MHGLAPTKMAHAATFGLIVVLLCGLFISLPVAFLLAACFCIAIMPDRRFHLLLALLGLSLLTILNLTKAVEGDLSNYISVHEYLRFRPFTALFDVGELKSVSGSYRLTEIGFYGPMWVISRLVPNANLAVAIEASLGIYLPTLAGLHVLRQRTSWSDAHFLALSMFVLFAAINFVQTTHLLRQYVSSSLVFLAFAFFLTGRRRLAALVALYGCTVHNGTVLLAGSLLLLALLFPPGVLVRGRRIELIVRGVLAAAVMGASFALGAFDQLQALATEGAGNIGPGHFLVVGALLGIYFLTTRSTRADRYMSHYVTMAALTVYIFSLGFFILGVPLFALRYFAYLEWLFGLMAGAILLALPHRRFGVDQFARWALCAITVAVFAGRLMNAPWSYAGERAGLFSMDFFSLVGSLSY